MGIYKDCDIRGRFGQELSLIHADKLGQAIIYLKGPSDILIGGDGRISTKPLKSRLITSLVTGGCTVVDLGEIPTPAFYYARRTLGIECGVMVTASHNPAHDNGFKIILGHYPITPPEMAEIKTIMEGELIRIPEKAGTMEKMDILPRYQAELCNLGSSLEGLCVVVDCANGMASLVARQIWQATGARTVFLFDHVDGKFPHHAPNPAKAENLKDLQQTVLLQRADMGVAYDGDADRVAFVDNHGRPLSSDKAIVLFSRLALKEKSAVIVYDQKCSRIVPEAIRAGGGEAIMERSGHTFIKTTFLQRSAAYAGEISGHHFFDVIAGDDGVYASLRMTELLVASHQKLADLADSIPTYPVTPDLRLEMPGEKVEQIIADLKHNLKDDITRYTSDGIRVEFSDGWGLARPSVTESALTLRFEGDDEAALHRIMQRFELAAMDLNGILPTWKY